MDRKRSNFRSNARRLQEVRRLRKQILRRFRPQSRAVGRKRSKDFPESRLLAIHLHVGLLEGTTGQD